eukprot:scaffold29274_cov63-Phaeocystis_antarctica.AAC.4
MIDPPYVNPQHRVPPKRWAYRCAVLLAGLLTLALVAALVWVVFVYVMLCADTYARDGGSASVLCVPAACVLYVPEAQGSLEALLYVRRARTSLGRADAPHTVWCTPGHAAPVQDDADGRHLAPHPARAAVVAARPASRRLPRLGLRLPPRRGVGRQLRHGKACQSAAFPGHSLLPRPPGTHRSGPGLLHECDRRASTAQTPVVAQGAAVSACQSRRLHCC